MINNSPFNPIFVGFKTAQVDSRYRLFSKPIGDFTIWYRILISAYEPCLFSFWMTHGDDERVQHIVGTLVDRSEAPTYEDFFKVLATYPPIIAIHPGGTAADLVTLASVKVMS